MAINKTRPRKVSVASYVGAIVDQSRRADAKVLVALMKKATGEEPKNVKAASTSRNPPTWIRRFWKCSSSKPPPRGAGPPAIKHRNEACPDRHPAPGRAPI